MNISGPQYSAATAGLRQPKKIKDQQFKLVYIYPMLCDSSLSKYKDLLRTFISVSMLKEIYTSNSIGFFNMGSNISPLVDEQGNVIDIDDHVMSSVGNRNSFGAENPLKTKHDIQQNIKFDIQDKINERSAYIKKLINIDPALKLFKPYVEMITMNNFINIPVVVGTKCLDINKVVLLMVLTVAVADKKLTMDSYSDIERIFRIIKQTSNNDLNSILNHLIDVPIKDKTLREKVLGFFSTGNSGGSSRTQRLRQTANTFLPGSSKINSFPGRMASKIEARRTNVNPGLNDTVPIQTQGANQLADLADVSKNDVSQAQVFFKLCMDPEMMARQFGYDSSRGQLKDTFARINPKINRVFENANNMFAKEIWPTHIVPVLNSFLYTIIPRDSGINVSEIVIALQNGDPSTKIKGIFGPILDYITNDFKKAVNNTIEKQGPDKADETLDNLRALCVDHFSDTSDNIGYMQDSISRVALDGPDYSIDEHISYEKMFEKIITKIAPHMHIVESAFKQILPSSLIDDLFVKQTSAVINDGLNSVINYLNTIPNYPNSTPFFRNEGVATVADSHISAYISSSKKQIIFYIRKYILYIIQYILCKYVNETKVAVETAKHDVIDSNNYSLILPLETIMMLANAYAAKSYRNLYTTSKHNSEKANNNSVNTSDMQLIKNLNQNYVKGIINFMHKQLNVPNLFIIDEGRQEVYYKLMYQSNVNKIKLNTIQTYSDNILNSYSSN